MSGLAINTPIVEASNGPKTVAGLPSAISAMKYHMFNDIIWPNLSDEDGGAGLITYQRLVEGGNPRFGRGESRGYVRACEGLVTKCLSVSHGRCKQRYDAESGRHHRIGSAVFPDQMVMSNARNLSIDQSDGAMYSPARSPHLGPGLGSTPSKDTANWGVVESSAFFIRDDSTGKEIIIFGDIEPDSISLEPRNKRVWEIAAPKIVNGSLRAIFIECSYNDAIDDETLYGHLCPRHLIAELLVLASKVEEARPDHKQKGQRRRGRSSKRKRKDSDTADYAREQPVSPHSTRQVTTHLAKPRDNNGNVNDKSPTSGNRTSVSTQTPDGGKDDDNHGNENDDALMTDRPESRRSNAQKSRLVEIDGEPEHEIEHDGETGLSRQSVQWTDSETGPPPLAGFKVFIIHVKDTLIDGPHPSERILEELRAQSEEAGLGCEFHVPFQGEGILI
ncbi:Cyclic-AMP phosphodiesterase, class-II [Penicillium occitanis (nom. inval.)]|nr:Cyclic-AMP phosphodiesterase, class-II [Penicillium occitanis (nom. inval.)]